MDYESLLDEIMVNTVSAKELIGYPQKDYHYAVCPWTIEFHTSIFLSSILLAFNQNNPLIMLVQVEDLPESAMIYTGKIGPHFGRIRDLKNTIPNIFKEKDFAETEQNYYQYLDKIFCYLSVINTNQNHIVVFIKKGEKNKELTNILKELLEKDYSLLVFSDTHKNLPLSEEKEKSEELIEHLKKKELSLEETKQFSALTILSELLPKQENPHTLEELVHSGEIGFNPKTSTALWFMMS